MMNDKKITAVLFALQGVGAIFVGIFLAAYLGGLFVVPQTTVFHSVFTVKLALAVLGAVLMAIILAAVVLAVLKRK
jgi:signal transduction histidine kinase